MAVGNPAKIIVRMMISSSSSAVRPTLSAHPTRPSAPQRPQRGLARCRLEDHTLGVDGREVVSPPETDHCVSYLVARAE